MTAHLMLFAMLTISGDLLARAPDAFLRRRNMPPPRTIQPITPVTDDQQDPIDELPTSDSSTPEPIFRTVAPRKQVQFSQLNKNQTAFNQTQFTQQAQQPVVEFKQVEGSNDGGEATVADMDIAAWYATPVFYVPDTPSALLNPDNAQQEALPNAASSDPAAAHPPSGPSTTPAQPITAGGFGGGGGGSGALMGSGTPNKKDGDDEAQAKHAAEQEQRALRQALVKQKKDAEQLRRARAQKDIN